MRAQVRRIPIWPRVPPLARSWASSGISHMSKISGAISLLVASARFSEMHLTDHRCHVSFALGDPSSGANTDPPNSATGEPPPGVATTAVKPKEGIRLYVNARWLVSDREAKGAFRDCMACASKDPGNTMDYRKYVFVVFKYIFLLLANWCRGATEAWTRSRRRTWRHVWFGKFTGSTPKAKPPKPTSAVATTRA